MADSAIIYTLLCLLFVFFIGLIVWLIFLQLNINNINGSGTIWTITQGSADKTSDLVPGGGANLFIAQSTATGYVATIQASPTSASGQNLWVKNRSTNQITIAVSSGVAFDSGLLGNTIQSGKTAQFVYTDTNQILRLN